MILWFYDSMIIAHLSASAALACPSRSQTQVKVPVAGEPDAGSSPPVTLLRPGTEHSGGEEMGVRGGQGADVHRLLP